MHLELRFLRLLALVSGLTFGPALFCISFVEWRLEVRLLQQGKVVEAEVTDLAINSLTAYSSLPEVYDIRYRARNKKYALHLAEAARMR